jgi:hypothetical protein
MFTKVAVEYGAVTELSKPQTRILFCESISARALPKTSTPIWGMVRYYLAVTRNLVGWKSTLHAQGQGGPVVIEMTKANLTSSPSDILIQNLSDGCTTRLQQDDFLATNNMFTGPDGRKYRWKWSSVISLDNSLQVSRNTASRVRFGLPVLLGLSASTMRTISLQAIDVVKWRYTKTAS